jgi:hypothetical protein
MALDLWIDNFLILRSSNLYDFRRSGCDALVQHIDSWIPLARELLLRGLTFAKSS